MQQDHTSDVSVIQNCISMHH